MADSQIQIALLTEIRDSIKNLNTFQKTTTKTFKTIEKSTSKLSKSFQSLRAVTGGVLAADAIKAAGTTVVRVLKNVTTEFASTADEIGKTAAKLGIGVESLQRLQFAAEQTGVSAETFNTAFQRFTRRTQEAANGTGEAQAALKALGVQLRDNNGNLRPTEDLLRDVSDGLAQVENQSDRVAIAFKLFDTEGVSLVNTLQGGSFVLDEYGKRAEDLGLITERQVSISERFRDTVNEGQKVLQFFSGVIAELVLPSVSTFIKALIEVSKENRGQIIKSLREAGKTFGSFGKIVFSAASFAIKIWRVFSASIVNGVNTILLAITKLSDAVGFSLPEVFRRSSSDLQDSTQGVIDSLIEFSDPTALDIFADKYEEVSERGSRASKDFGVNLKKVNIDLKALSKNTDDAKKKLDGLIGVSLIRGIESTFNIKFDLDDESLKSLGDAITNSLKAITSGIAQGGEEGARKAVTGAVTAALDVLLPGIGQLLSPLIDLASMGAEVLSAAVTSFFAELPQVFVTLIEGLLEFPVALIESIPLFIEGLIEAIPSFITALVAAGPDIIFAIIQSIPRLIESFISFIPKIVTSLVQKLGELLPQGVVKFIERLVSSAGQFIDGMIREVGRFIEAAAKGIGEAIIKVVEDLIGGIGGVAGDIGSAIGDFINDPIGSVGNVLSDIGDFFGFASGGVVPGTGNTDSVPALLTPGEFVIDKDRTSSLFDLIDSIGGGTSASGSTQLAGPSTINVNLQVGEEQLANVLLRLNQQGFRVA